MASSIAAPDTQAAVVGVQTGPGSIFKQVDPSVPASAVIGATLKYSGTITAPSISLRVLPNDEDFGQYYEDRNAPQPVGNKDLTFEIVYQKVLRTYYLLYPVMNSFVPLNSESAVAGSAQAILRLTDPKQWMSSGYMPRTRDMSASRRTLLQA